MLNNLLKKARSNTIIIVLLLFLNNVNTFNVLNDDYQNSYWICSKASTCKHVISDTEATTEYNHVNNMGFETQNMCNLVCGKYGSLWPRPTGATSLGDNVIQFNPNKIRFDLLYVPISTKKYISEIRKIFISNIQNECKPNCTLDSDIDMEIHIFIRQKMSPLSWTTDESYNLNITTISTTVRVQIDGTTVYGIRHGLETLSQLITLKPGPYGSFSNGLVVLSRAVVMDHPVFAHRGLLLDTARNFIPVQDIERTLDGMASSKLNVFHWHATDTQSFPLEIKRVPQLAAYGAYSRNETYKQNDIRHIIQYAKYRGIRVIIELDAPAHAGNGWQWGQDAGIGNLAVCVNQQPWRKFCIEPPCGQLNPANPNLYLVLRELFKEFVELLPLGESLHMGGDEIYFNCWNSTDEIVNFMANRSLGREEKDFLKLWAEFQATALRIWDDESGTSPSSRETRQPPIPIILWSSHLTDPKHIEKFLQKDRYIIQTWVPSTDQSPMLLLSKGYRLIISTKDAWYLDHGFWGRTSYYQWRTVYDNRIPVVDGVLGGEACMWTEYVDENALDSRVWPRAAAVGERLWADPKTSAVTAENRFYRHYRRLISKGLRPEAVVPKWCLLNEGDCK